MDIDLYQKEALAPLRSKYFRHLWLASIISNIGTWMQTVGATWLMGDLNSSPIMVALIQAASSLPTFFFSIPAGALADLFDRRKVLILTQLLMMIAAAILGLITWNHTVTIPKLFLLTILLGIGAAIHAPTWQAIIPEIVPKEEFVPAIALGNVSFNIARAVGPALGGMVLALTSPAFNFILNSLSFLAVIFVLYKWERKYVIDDFTSSERLLAAIQTGFKSVYNSTFLKNAFLRILLFTFPASALWALLPVVARDHLNSGPKVYGILLGCLGLGAIFGAFQLPSLRKSKTSDQIIGWMTFQFAIATLCNALLRKPLLLELALLFGGISWLIILSILNSLIQISVSDHIRARISSIYSFVFLGSFTSGTIFWGILANHLSTSIALILAAITLIFSIFLIPVYRLQE